MLNAPDGAREPEYGCRAIFVRHFLWPYGCSKMYARLRITNPDGGILGANRQVFTPLHSNASNRVESLRLVSKQEYVRSLALPGANYKPRLGHMERLRVSYGTYETSI